MARAYHDGDAARNGYRPACCEYGGVAKYWIGVASRDHVRNGVRGGFAQLGHGKLAPVRRLAKDDWIVYYSPRTALEGGEKVQAFTAIGRIIDDAPVQVEQAEDFHPNRRASFEIPKGDFEMIARAMGAAL